MIIRMFSMFQSINIPQGKSMGGSSMLNGMMFARGSPRDYDNWADMGNKGWDYQSVLPYFKKLENFEKDIQFDSGELTIRIFLKNLIM